MALFDWLIGLFSGSTTTDTPRQIEPMEINPATGLPMTTGIGSVDVAGNPYGIDLRRHEDLHDYGHHGSAGSMFDDWHHHETGSTGHSAGSSFDDWSHGSSIGSGNDPFDRW